MCCQQDRTQGLAGQSSCDCSCPMTSFMSKKKKIQALNTYKEKLEEQVDDINEYIKELESGK